MRGTTGVKSEKFDKKFWHRRFRKAVRRRLEAGHEVLPHFRELSDPWGMGKDGKRRFVWTGEKPDDPKDVGGSDWIRKMYAK